MNKRIHTLLAKSNLLQIASCFLIFAVLSNLIYIPCYFYIRNINRRNVIDHQQYQLDNGMQTLNTSMDALFNLTNTLSASTDYRTTYYSESDFTDLTLDKIRKTVNTCLLPFDCINESGLTMGDTILFNKKRIYYNKEYLSYDYYFTCDREGYLDEFNGAYCALPAAVFSSADQADYEAITIGWRWRKNNDMYFFAHYPSEALFSLFANSEVRNSSYLAVYSGDTLLAENGSALAKDYELLTAASSNQLDIRVVLQLSDSYIQQDLASMTQLIRIFITIVSLAAILWILVFSFVLWQPYRNISNALETQKERSRIHIFEKTLYRGLYGEESRKAFYDAFPDFPPRWQLVQFQYTSDNATVTPDMIQPILMQQLQKHLWNFFLPQNQDTLLALMLTVDSAEQELRSLCSQIEQQHHISVSFILSKIYHDPACLADAFQELEYEELSASPQSKSHSVSMQQLQTIYYALQCGDAKTAVRTLKNSSAKILASNDQFSAKYSYRMLSYVLVRLKLENNSILDVTIPPFNPDTMQKLFEEDLPGCFTLLAEQLRQQQTEQTQKLDQDILDFIRGNLANQQLGVTLVAEQFHISAPTLQKRMNACCGMTFSAYVEAARMEKAQQLLRDTTATVQEIAETVGYINANSFYKAYKRCFGEPPMSYRNRTDGN